MQSCSSRCFEYVECIQCQIFHSGPLSEDDCFNCTFNATLVDGFNGNWTENFTTAGTQCWFYDDDNCRVTFKYSDDADGPDVRVSKTKECPPILNVVGICLAIVGAVFAVGCTSLLCWKLCTHIKDKRECAQFENERKTARWSTVRLIIRQIFRNNTTKFGVIYYFRLRIRFLLRPPPLS